MISFLRNLGKAWLAAGVVVATVLLVGGFIVGTDLRTSPVAPFVWLGITLGLLYVMPFVFLPVVRALDLPRPPGPLINRRLTLASQRAGGAHTLVLVQTYVCLSIGSFENEAHRCSKKAPPALPRDCRDLEATGPRVDRSSPSGAAGLTTPLGKPHRVSHTAHSPGDGR